MTARTRGLQRAVLGFAVGAALGAMRLVAQAPDPFYGALLREGEALADQGKAAAAARSLRTACFGLLDQPLLLARCLVRLSLAQAASGDAEGFHATFGRLLELEAQSPSYAAAELSPALRKAFEQAVQQRIATRVLADSPSFAHLLPPEKDAGKKKDRKAREPQPEPRPAPPPASAPPAVPAVAAAAAPGKSPTTTVPATPVPPTNAPGSSSGKPVAAPAAGLSSEEEAALERARASLRTARLASDLDGAAAQAVPVAEAHPESAAANALAGEIAYRASRWSDAARFLRRSGPPADQPLLGFYLAVALFESGDRAGAATVLRPVLPRLQRTPYVEAYEAKILKP